MGGDPCPNCDPTRVENVSLRAQVERLRTAGEGLRILAARAHIGLGDPNCPTCAALEVWREAEKLPVINSRDRCTEIKAGRLTSEETEI